MEAALDLVDIAPLDTNNAQTTGSQPRGYSCLHFACDGSDKDFMHDVLVRALLRKSADLEAKDASDNTPFLTASGTGVADVVKVLINARADVTAKNKKRKGALQKAQGSSTDVATALSKAPVQTPQTFTTESGRTRTGVSESRQTRYSRTAQDPDARPKNGKGSNKGQSWSQASGSQNWWSSNPWYDNR
jgi:ankyrin repeat protein